MNIVEHWCPIENQNGYYISSLGRILSKKKSKNVILKTHVTREYEYIKINGKNYRVHRLVANAFVPNPNNLPEVNHKDENKLNNCAWNLEWCNHLYNMNYGNMCNKRKRKCKTILQYTMNGEFIAEYESASEAEKILGISANSIRESITNKYRRKSAGGYTWKYK